MTGERKVLEKIPPAELPCPPQIPQSLSRLQSRRPTLWTAVSPED